MPHHAHPSSLLPAILRARGEPWAILRACGEPTPAPGPASPPADCPSAGTTLCLAGPQSRLGRVQPITLARATIPFHFLQAIPRARGEPLQYSAPAVSQPLRRLARARLLCRPRGSRAYSRAKLPFTCVAHSSPSYPAILRARGEHPTLYTLANLWPVCVFYPPYGLSVSRTNAISATDRDVTSLRECVCLRTYATKDNMILRTRSSFLRYYQSNRHLSLSPSTHTARYKHWSNHHAQLLR
jgi:hypothetical protein